MPVNAPIRQKRCAIYTRKSGADPLKDGVGSLEVQREICSAYIRSQRPRGWVQTARDYDDEGYGGGNMERSALTELLAAVQQGLVDVIVI